MNVNKILCKDIDEMFSRLKQLAVEDGSFLHNELRIITDFLESEATINTGIINDNNISQRMLICAQNAMFYTAKGEIIKAIGEMWDVVDYHNPEDELTTIDIILLSLLTKNLYNKAQDNGLE